MSNPHVYDKAKYHLESVEDAGLPDAHASNHIVVILRWLIENGLTSEEFSTGEAFDRYRSGELSIQDLFLDWWDGCLVSDMLSEAGNAFAMHYFDYEKGGYLRDYTAVLGGSAPSEFHVEYSEANYAKLKKVMDQRYREWTDGQPRATPANERPVARPQPRGRLAGMLFGVILVLIGATLLVWIAYNLFVEMQPEAEGLSPVGPAVFASLLVALGIGRMRKAVSPRPDGQGSGRS